MAENKTAEFTAVKDYPAVEKPEFAPLNELFDEAKRGMLLIIESNIEVAKRVDNLASMREAAFRFYGKMFDELEPYSRMEIAKTLLDVSVQAYKEVYNRTLEFSLEEFEKEDMRDYYEDIVPDLDSIKNESDLLRAIVTFNCVQPYGSKMNQLHQMVLEEIEKRAAYED